MPEVLSCMFTETARSKIGITLGIVNWVCVLTSLGLIGIGLYIKLSITKFTNLIEGYDGDALVYWLITVGIISVIINIGGGFCCFIAADPSKRDTCKVWLLVYFISSVIMCFLTLIGGSMCYASISHLERSFSGGILKAMRQYALTPILKQEIDELQMDFSCCGNDAYSDWFENPWILADYSPNPHGNTPDKEGYFHDDVPFSCCDKHAKRPCIHSNIHTNGAHKGYDYKQHLTVYQNGCVENLMDFFGDNLLVNCGAFVMAVLCLQSAITILVRYYQTSIYEALKLDEPDAETKGYLFSYNQETVPEVIPKPQSNINIDTKRSKISNMDSFVYSDDEFDNTYAEIDPLLQTSPSKAAEGDFRKQEEPTKSQHSNIYVQMDPETDEPIYDNIQE